MTHLRCLVGWVRGKEEHQDMYYFPCTSTFLCLPNWNGWEIKCFGEYKRD